MPPQEPQPTHPPSPVIAAEVVTLTVYSSGSATQSGLPSLSGGGGSSVPVAAIVGGVAGGVVLAVLLVIIWKHWGRVIKRTERYRRKEVVRFLCILFARPLLSPVGFLACDRKDWLTISCRKPSSPSGKTLGGMLRRVSGRSRNIAQCSHPTPRRAK
jgi:hypothetical protein